MSILITLFFILIFAILFFRINFIKFLLYIFYKTPKEPIKDVNIQEFYGGSYDDVFYGVCLHNDDVYPVVFYNDFLYKICIYDLSDLKEISVPLFVNAVSICKFIRTCIILLKYILYFLYTLFFCLFFFSLINTRTGDALSVTDFSDFLSFSDYKSVETHIKEIDEKIGKVPSFLKIYDKEKISRMFKKLDFINSDDTKECLDYMVDFAKNRELMIEKNRGILLYGAPGVGKTICAYKMCEQLDAILIKVCHSDLKSKFVGSMEKNINKVFDIFYKISSEFPDRKVVLFVDEAESIGNRNDMNINNVDCVNVYLTLIDDFDRNYKNANIIFATNYKHRIDEAIIRPGRIGSMLEFSPMRRISDVKDFVIYKFKKLAKGNNLDISFISDDIFNKISLFLYFFKYNDLTTAYIDMFCNYIYYKYIIVHYKKYINNNSSLFGPRNININSEIFNIDFFNSILCYMATGSLTIPKKGMSTSCIKHEANHAVMALLCDFSPVYSDVKLTRFGAGGITGSVPVDFFNKNINISDDVYSVLSESYFIRSMLILMAGGLGSSDSFGVSGDNHSLNNTILNYFNSSCFYDKDNKIDINKIINILRNNALYIIKNSTYQDLLEKVSVLYNKKDQFGVVLYSDFKTFYSENIENDSDVLNLKNRINNIVNNVIIEINKTIFDNDNNVKNDNNARRFRSNILNDDNN